MHNILKTWIELNSACFGRIEDETKMHIIHSCAFIKSGLIFKITQL